MVWFFGFFLQAGNIQTLHLDLSPGSAWSLTSWHFHGTPRPPPALCAPLSVLGGVLHVGILMLLPNHVSAPLLCLVELYTSSCSCLTAASGGSQPNPGGLRRFQRQSSPLASRASWQQGRYGGKEKGKADAL